MSGDSVEDIKKSVRVYLTVFATLGILTILTVIAAELHIPHVGIAIGIAMVIAVIKGSLVALYFMHLIAEVRVIYWALALTVGFFIVLMILPALSEGGLATYEHLVGGGGMSHVVEGPAGSGTSHSDH